MGDDGVYRPARMIVTFQGSGGSSAAAGKSPARKASGKSAGGSSASDTASMSGASAGNGRPYSAPGPPVSRTSSSPERRRPVSNGPSSAGAQLQQLSLNEQRVDSARRPQSDQASGASGTGDKRAVLPSATPPSASLPPAAKPQLSPRPSSSGVQAAVPAVEQGKNQRARGFAKRFMQRLSNRKDKFQGKEQPYLQPARDEDDMTGTVNQRRSLASKLLARRPSRIGKDPSGRGGADLEKLAFGGHELSARHPSVGSFSVDDDASVRQGGSTGAVSDDEEGLEAVPEGSSDDGADGSEGPGRVVEHNEGDGSLASDSDADDDDERHGRMLNGDEEPLPSPLTREALQQAATRDQRPAPQPQSRANSRSNSGAGLSGPSSSGRGSWLRSGGINGGDAASVLDDAASSILEFAELEEADDDAGGGGGSSGGGMPPGVYAYGRLSGFELIGERGSKVPNLTIGNADVSATVFVRFVFEYDKATGWHPGKRPSDRPRFHVDKLRYTISGNNVPMPQQLIKHILRVAIPGLIQRRLLGLLPKELGEYMLTAKKGLLVDADVGVVGPSLDVLDADIGFEVRGPAKSAKEARKQQKLYAAAKEARGLLGLSLPQAQVLAELFNGTAAVLDPPRPASISQLISFQATYERHPQVMTQLCKVIDTAYHVLAQAQGRVDVLDFSFVDFLAGPVARMRRKPAKARVVVRELDVSLNADAIVTAIHDFIHRSIEEMIVKGPLTDPGATLESMKESVADELEVLHAWHAFAQQELQHFKSKFRGAAGTVLTAADRTGFSAGVENFYYEGPLRLRVPVSIQLDQDGAVSFELPLPSPEGKLGVVRPCFAA